MFKNKKIYCLIPARGGSKGIKNKNIIEFCGSPLISHSINQAVNSKYIDKTFVSSDSDQILQISENCGATAVKRPVELSEDHSTSESVLEHFLQTTNCDLLVFLQATSPLRESGDIDSAIEKFCEGEYDSLFAATEAEDFFVWSISGKEKRSLTYDYKNRLRRQEINNLVLENGSFYIFCRDKFLKNKNRLFGKIGHFLMDRWKMYEIDSQEDLELCKFLYERKINVKQ
jgi:CMP-N,N'-diacetyllegionaminic acid synthase